jgi:peptidoglycan hydrolase FlgJ
LRAARDRTLAPMNPLDPNRMLDTTAQGLAADARSLDALKRAAARDPKAALKGAAQQFEALFLQMVLKSMRDAIPKSGLLDSDSQQTYTSLLDQQLSTQISKSGTGLADVIARQLGRYMNDAKPAPTPGADARPAAAVTPGAAAIPGATVAPSARTAIDRYAEIAAVNPNSAPRLTESQRTNAAAHAAYLARSTDGVQAPAPASQAQGADAATAAGADTTPAADDARLGYAQRTFVTRMWDHAASAQHATGIPAKFVLAQAALESGWGQREIRDASGLPTYNLFGIKAGASWQGRTVDVVTTEYNNDVAKKVVEKFRAYNNYSEAFRDWAQLIAGNKRYAQVVESGRAGESGTGYAHGLARAGYATDPQYGAKLARVIGSLARVRSGAG